MKEKEEGLVRNQASLRKTQLALKTPVLIHHGSGGGLRLILPANAIRNSVTQALRKMDNVKSNENLMVEVTAGNPQAFEALVIRHQTSILNLIYRFIGDRTKAKDLAQEVFLRVWQAAKSYKPEAKFTTWIYRITANLCFNELKSSRRKKLFQFLRPETDHETGTKEDFPDRSPSPEDLLLAKECSLQITEALQSLPGNQRLAIILKRYDDLSYEEIARVLGCPVPAVESLLARGKRTLLRKLTFLQK